jgi:hypothetical protein
MSEHIGPILLTRKHQRQNSKFDKGNKLSENVGKSINSIGFKGRSNTESWTIKCSKVIAKQLEGLPDWEEPFFVDTSQALHELENAHRGWYLFDNIESDDKAPFKIPVSFKGICLNRNPLMFFERDYSLINQIPFDYPLAVPLEVEESFYSTFVDTDGKIKIDTTIKSQQAGNQATGVWDRTTGDSQLWWYDDDRLMVDGYARSQVRTDTYWVTDYLVMRKGFNIPSNTDITAIKASLSMAGNQPGHPKWMDVELRIGSAITGKYGFQYNNDGWWVHEFGGPDSLNGVNPTWGLGPEHLNASNLASFHMDFFAGAFANHSVHVDWFDVVAWYRFNSGTYQRFTPIDPDKTNWSTITVTQTLNGGTIKWEVLRASDNYPLLTNQAGPVIDISSLAHTHLRLVATLNAVNGVSPSITSVAVTETGEI